MFLLTALPASTIIYQSLQKTMSGRGNPKITGPKAALHAVFLCPLKTNATLIRIQSVMTGLLRQRFALAGSGDRFSTLCKSVANSVERISGGYTHITGATAMNDHTQEPSISQGNTTPELELINICQQIGCIAESNAHFTAGLTLRIAETGKPVEQLTIAELLKIHRDHKEWFNSLFDGGEQ